ncbi:DNA damage-inducible transcript 4 protein [Phaenicophaeus curvirostris]|uniref:DNA damage-inducible transcript 4 protein n=1 Tax=Phaenicophaeus curvirostris TaxID=33595 RepID=UPI0037F0AFD3
MAGRWAGAESSDCESLGSASGSEGDAELAEERSLPDLELLQDPEDEPLCAGLMELVRATLGRAPLGARRGARVAVPAELLAQVRAELLRLAWSEPCGLRGALLDLCVERGRSCLAVGHIAVDPAVVPTFQLTLVLRLDSRLWPKIRGLFTSGAAFAPLKLSTGFRVIKKKLYSSEQLLVEEC